VAETLELYSPFSNLRFPIAGYGALERVGEECFSLSSGPPNLFFRPFWVVSLGHTP